MSLNKFDSSTYDINNSSKYLFFKNNEPINFSGAKNNIIKNSNAVKSNADYRKYLTNNANKIIENNSLLAQKECGYSKNLLQLPKLKKQLSPYVYTKDNINNMLKPEGYENSDLKNIYLSRQELQSRKTAQSIPIQ